MALSFFSHCAVLPYVNFQHVSYIESHVATLYKIDYYTNSSFRPKKVLEIERQIETILKTEQAIGLKTDYEKCRWVHNYLVKNIKYNYEAFKQPDKYPDAFTISGVFNDHHAVCEGIAKAFKLLCDQLNVETIVIRGISSLEGFGTDISHAWNVAKIDGIYTHIDVTWDIGVSQICKRTRFDYFCLSDEQIQADHSFDDQILPKSTSNQLSFFSKTGRLFTDGRQLRNYLKSELNKGAENLYFKIEDHDMEPGLLSKKVQENVNNAITSYCKYPCSIEMVMNEHQQCYFYRLIRQ